MPLPFSVVVNYRVSGSAGDPIVVLEEGQRLSGSLQFREQMRGTVEREHHLSAPGKYKGIYVK